MGVLWLEKVGASNMQLAPTCTNAIKELSCIVPFFGRESSAANRGRKRGTAE